MRLTLNRVRAARPGRRPYRLSDGAGLSFHVAVSGRKTWRLRFYHEDRQEELLLGVHPQLTLGAARERAAEIRERVARRQNPAEDRRRMRRCGDRWTTVEEFGARWLREVVAKVRKQPKVVERVLRRDVYPSMGRRPMAQVTPEEVQQLVYRRRDTGRPAAAAMILRTLERLFEYGQACGLVTANPAEGTPLKFVVQHRSRTRALSVAELRIFLQRLDSPVLNRRMALALRLILLTLARKSELRQARWEHVDFERAIWEVPEEHSKTGKPHIVYLSRQALECFRGLKAVAGKAEVVLPMRDALTVPMAETTLNLQMRKVRWDIAHFTPHDLRRTGSTILNELGYNPDWIEKALNHSAKGIRGVYNRAQYAEQRRQMLQEWADWIGRLA